MLVFCWYLVRERKKIKICLLRIAQFYFRALLVARITLFRSDYIFAQEQVIRNIYTKQRLADQTKLPLFYLLAGLLKSFIGSVTHFAFFLHCCNSG